MITFLTTAKPFVDASRIHQMNAIRSWKALHPDVEVLLFGDGEGYSAAARELGVIHIPGVETSETGVPRVDRMVAIAAERGRHELRAYVNCDVILMEDLLRAAARIRRERFLMVARRWNLDVDREIDFSDAGWPTKLRTEVARRGELFTVWGIDFLLYRGDVWGDLPPMVVGRAGYDNWLVYRCRANRVPVVDASTVVTAVHQNHDYGHLHAGRDETFHGPEAQRNAEMAGGSRHLWLISDADWRLGARRLERNWCAGDSRRCAEVFQILRAESPWAGTEAARRMVAVGCEFCIRLQELRNLRIAPLLRFPLWASLALAGRR